MSNRYYSSALNDGKGASNFPYIWDSALVITSGVGKPITGAWRPYTTSDISSTTVNNSGNISVGNVAVTGGQITVTNGNITVANPILTISGITQTTIQNSVLATSGITTINSGTYVIFATGLTSGQFQIPVGAKQWSIAIESGSAYMNNMLLNTSTILNGGGYDGRFILGSAINVGCTGGRAIVFYET